MGVARISIDKKSDTAIIAFEGQTDYNDVQSAITYFYKGALTKFAIWDFTDADVSKVANSELRELGDFVSKVGKARDRCFDAIVVPGLLKFGMARVFVGYATAVQKDPDALKIGVFKTMREAYDWMRENDGKGLKK